MTASEVPTQPAAPGPTGSGAPEAGRSGRAPWTGPAVVGGAVAAGTAAIAAWNPGDDGVGLCWSKVLFHVDCPFCGGLRCVGALARGDWLAAADHNVVLAVALPLAAVLWAVWLVRSVRGERLTLPRPGPWVVAGLVAFLVAFTVLRNVGGAPWIDWLASSASTG